LPEGCEYQSPKGGMFFWIRLPEGLDAMALLPTAVEANIAYVPGAAFYARNPDPRALRLSFVTLTPERIREGVAILGRVLNDALNGSHAPTP
jgi:2-aminoadipate transaminase